MVVNLTYELQKDDLITWIPLKDIYFSKFHYSQNFGKLGLCGCPGTLLDLSLIHISEPTRPY